MKPVSNLPHMIPDEGTIASDPLDALIDLCDAAPTEGDDRLAVWFETKLHAELVAAAESDDEAAVDRAKLRAVAGGYYRARICTALRLSETGEPRRAAA